MFNWFDRQDFVAGFFNAVEMVLIGAAFGFGFSVSAAGVAAVISTVLK